MAKSRIAFKVMNALRGLGKTAECIAEDVESKVGRVNSCLATLEGRDLVRRGRTGKHVVFRISPEGREWFAKENERPQPSLAYLTPSQKKAATLRDTIRRRTWVEFVAMTVMEDPEILAEVQRRARLANQENSPGWKYSA